MPSAAALRLQIESALSDRIASALTPAPRVIRPTAPTGIAALDERLGGGLAVGAISELTGPECSGRTSLALSFVARMTEAGRVCAWVDVSDALDPESAAAAGVDLERLLWVRCGAGAQKSERGGKDVPQGLKPSVPAAGYGTAEAVPLQNDRASSQAQGVHFQNDRAFSQAEGVRLPGNSGFPQAVRLRPFKTEPHPGVRKIPEPNPGAGHHHVTGNDTNVRPACEALPQALIPGCSEPLPTIRRRNREAVATRAPQACPAPADAGFHEAPGLHGVSAAQRPRKEWPRLDQALRATDLLLQAGGFSAIVLDMGSVAPEYALRVPLATWFRYRAAAERTQASMLLLTQQACTKSSAGLVLTLAPGGMCGESATVLTGAEYRAEIARERFSQAAERGRKPPQPERSVLWQSHTPWAGRR